MLDSGVKFGMAPQALFTMNVSDTQNKILSDGRGSVASSYLVGVTAILLQ